MAPSQGLHIKLTRAFRAEHKLWAKELSAIGVSQGQPKMLLYILKNDGCMQKDIADGTGIEPPSATSILTVMEREGLVLRRQNQDDHRRYRVFITEKGKEKQKQIEEIAKELEKIELADFSQEEKTQFFEFLARIEKNAAGSEKP